MIPTDVDASLCSGEPTRDSLEDGFSPPTRDSGGSPAHDLDHPAAADAKLPPKSLF